MSVLFSGTNQGRYTQGATAQNLYIPLRTDVDWMYVKNETVSYAAGAGTGAEFFWQRGDTAGRGDIYVKTAVTNALTTGQIAAGAGFYLYDNTINTPGAAIATAAITAGPPPVVATANTGTLGTNLGQIVRLFDPTGALQLSGLDFEVGAVVANTSFALRWMPAIVAAGASTGLYRQIPYNPYYYPSTRTIVSITAANPAVIVMSVSHNYTIGMKVRFKVPADFGMTQMDGLTGTIINTNAAANSITVDIDSSAFTAFAFPITTAGRFTPAQVIPIGEDTGIALYNPTTAASYNILADATENRASMGILLMSGANSPAGVATNTIKWIAGKSYNTTIVPTTV